MSNKPYIMVDLDNTLAQYRLGDEAAELIRPPTPGAVDAIKQISTKYSICIWTARQRKGPICKWLKQHGIPCDRLVYGRQSKPEPLMIIDDRAFGMQRPFTSQDWEDVLQQLMGNKE